MKFIFLRHGEAQHNLNEPDSFQMKHPRLTKNGIQQAQNLRENFHLIPDDIVVASPTYRTLETANIITKDCSCNKLISYAVGPRIYPYKENAKTLPCDEVLVGKELVDFAANNSFHFLHEDALNNREFAVNHMAEKSYQNLVSSFLKWCKGQDIQRIFIVTHDGTIHTFKEIILNKKFTRDDMVNEGQFIILDF